MSAIDETWRSGDDELGFDGDVLELPETFLAHDGRLRLAACAPEALRMLLALEWSGGSIGGQCVICGRTEHRDDCAWLALMKKAGLR